MRRGKIRSENRWRKMWETSLQFTKREHHGQRQKEKSGNCLKLLWSPRSNFLEEKGTSKEERPILWNMTDLEEVDLQDKYRRKNLKMTVNGRKFRNRPKGQVFEFFPTRITRRVRGSAVRYPRVLHKSVHTSLWPLVSSWFFQKMWRRLAWPLQVAIRSTKDAKWTFGSRLVKKCAPMVPNYILASTIAHLFLSPLWWHRRTLVTSANINRDSTSKHSWKHIGFPGRVMLWLKQINYI